MRRIASLRNLLVWKLKGAGSWGGGGQFWVVGVLRDFSRYLFNFMYASHLFTTPNELAIA
jgi:hypothetical protein